MRVAVDILEEVALVQITLLSQILTRKDIKRLLKSSRKSVTRKKHAAILYSPIMVDRRKMKKA